MTKNIDLDEKFTKFSKEASSYIDRKKREKEKKDYKKKHGRDKFAFAGKSMDRKHSMGIAAEFDPKVNENKIVIGGKELDREWTGWWWRKNEKWTVVDGKNNMLASAKSSGEAEKWMKKLKDASQTRGDFSLAIGNPKLMLNHGQFGMPGLDFDKIFKSVNKDPDQLTIRKIDKKDHDRYFERAKKVNKKYDYTNLELTYDGGRKHYAPKQVKENYDKNQLLRVQHDEKLIAEAGGNICALKIAELRSKSMKAIWERKCVSQINKKTLGEKMDLIETSRNILIGEKKGDKEAYQKFFNKALAKFGVDSPAELKDDEKKKFYDYVDKNWKGDHEEEVEVKKKVTKEETV